MNTDNLAERIEISKENVKQNNVFYNIYLGCEGVYYLSPFSKWLSPEKYELAWEAFAQL